MNFALLGDDPAVLPLIRAIADHPNHKLTHAAAVRSIQPQIMELVPGVCVVTDGDDLLHIDELDAVIIASSDDVLLSGAKRLAADDRPLIVFPCYGQGASFVYELTLIRDDTHVLLFPAFVLRFEPEIRNLAKLIESGKIGKVLEFQLNREIPGTSHLQNSSVLTSTMINQALLGDVDLLRFLGGEYKQITALRFGNTSEGFTRSTVSLAGDGSPEAVWTATATSGKSNWNLTVTTDAGKAVLTKDENRFELTFDGESSEELSSSPADDNKSGSDPGVLLLERFEAVFSGERTSPHWRDAMRAFDIIEATHRSLKRRRTIDLHLETTSEQTIFKSQMTAVGCGVLVLTLLGLLLYLVMGSLFEINATVLEIARVVWLLPLAIFLVLQLLLLVAKPSAEESEKESS